MRIAKLVLLAASIASLFSTLSYAQAPDRITGALSGGPSVTLPGNVYYKAKPQYDQGPADPAMRLGTITLLTIPTASQEKALKRLAVQQQDPKSPDYHKWLTPEQWADRFGLSPNDVQKIVGWLKAHGFSDIHVARGRNWFMFSGTVAQVESAFGTEIHRYNVNGEMHYANASAPSVPAALSGIVTGFIGLHDFRPRPMTLRRQRPYYYDSNFQFDFLAPGDIATIYDINKLYNASTPIDGTGQKLAVMGQTDIYLADLNDFRSGFGLTTISTSNCTTNGSGVIVSPCNDPHFQYVLDGADPGLSSGDISESDLDLEISGSVARNAQVIFVNSTNVFNSMLYAIENNLAPVISLSYGNCELGIGSANITTLENALTQANNEGITIVNSAGDSGAAECDPNETDPNGTSATGGLAVAYPASSPEVTGVGGTAIELADMVPPSPSYWGTTNGTDGGSALDNLPFPETAWNDDAEFAEYCVANPTYSFCKQGGSTPVTGWVAITSAQTAQEDIGIYSGGGGPSNCATQNAGVCVSGFPQPSWQTVTISGQASARFSPDVSFLASPNFPGYIICVPLSELGLTGTTSSCSPGGAAGISNALALSPPPIIGGTSASAPLFAGIVTLLNQYLGSAAGLGNVNPMLYTLAKKSPSPFNQVTTGDNQVYCTAGTPGSPQPPSLDCPSSGVLGFQASNADSTTGYNLVTGLGSVDANNLAAAWALSQIGTTTALTASATSAYQSQSVTLTATVTQASGTTTPTGSVTFDYTNSSSGSGTLGSATLNSSGVATLSATSLPVGSDSITANYSGSMENSTSTATTVNVVAAFTLTPPTGTLQVTQGQSISAQVALALASGFTGTVTFACQNPGSEMTCTAPPSTNASGTVSFVVTTTAPSSELRRPFDRQRIFYAVLLPGLVGIMFTFSSRKRALGGMRMLGLIMVLGFSTLWLGSCGGNNSSTSNPGTPKGTYTINVTGTSGSITVPASFQLSVQ